MKQPSLSPPPMPMPPVAAVVALMLSMAPSAAPAAAADAAGEGAGAVRGLPVPANAAVSIELERDRVFLGENVLLHFVLENTGTTAIEFEVGGDYRGATREHRFKVTAIDERGREAEDPDPEAHHRGGLEGRYVLEPGQRWTRSLPLGRYRVIERPGVYTLRVRHDWGWKEAAPGSEGRKIPVAEAKITFLEPDERRADAIVLAMEWAPDAPEVKVGARSPPRADFSGLRHPAYLRPLRQRAEAGLFRAVDGIASIETPEATRALVELATDHRDPAMRSLAGRALALRLPEPPAPAGAAQPGAAQQAAARPAAPGYRERRRAELARRSWDPALAEPARAAARRLVEATDAETIEFAAAIFQRLGTRDDQAAVLGAMDRLLALAPPRTGDRDNILDPPAGVRGLLGAIRAMAERGAAVVPEAPDAPAERVLFLDTVARRPDVRPAGWQRHVASSLEHATPFVREWAVRAVPSTVPAELAAPAARAFADEDLGVVRAACDLAGRSKHAPFAPQVLKVLRAARHDWVHRAASDAAVELGLRYEAAEIWASRLDEPGMTVPALTFLATLVKYPGHGTGANANLSADEVAALKKAWHQFLTAHAQRVRSGPPFVIGEPPLHEGLFGRAFTFFLGDGKQWPSAR